ncbi:hypothetical protein ABT009_40525 [Streptomyces sp. NPDC002896]|uniref:hypothetical protein n=1 Tax=Streptomyces sp. NPDC002896 TaxID=3154438 RepID=UPI00331F8F75
MGQTRRRTRTRTTTRRPSTDTLRQQLANGTSVVRILPIQSRSGDTTRPVPPDLI